MIGSTSYNSTLEVYSLRKLISYNIFNQHFSTKLTNLFCKKLSNDKLLKDHIKNFTFDEKNKQYIIVTDRDYDSFKIQLSIINSWNCTIKNLYTNPAVQMLFNHTNGVDMSKINLAFKVLDNAGFDFIISQAFPVLNITPNNQLEEYIYSIHMI